ncbi:MAG: hypothetical protein WBL93_09560 [Lutisporaceae bacterium]
MKAREQINNSILTNKQKVLNHYLPLFENEDFEDMELIGNNHKVVATPIFITREQNRIINDDLNKVMEILFQIPEISFGGDYESYFNELGFGEQVKEVLHKYKFRKQHLNLLRPDCIYDGKNLKVLEFNISSSLGGILTNDIMGRVVHQDIMEKIGLLSENKCEFFNVAENLAKYLRKSVPEKEKIKLALLYKNERYEKLKSAIMLLKKLFEQTGMEVLPCDPSDLDYDGCLKLGNQVIDIAYRLFLWDFKEFGGGTTLQPLINAIDDNKVEFFVHVGSRMYSAKANLGLLSILEDSPKISSSAREAIGRIIPWTRILEDQGTMYKGRRIDLIEYVAKNKDEFIIKPSVAAGGKDVIIGRDTSAGEWNALIEKNSASRNLVVQEFYKAAQLKLPIVYSKEKDVRIEDLQCLFSPFLIDGRVEGYFVRCQGTDNKIINLAYGAISTCAVLI